MVDNELSVPSAIGDQVYAEAVQALAHSQFPALIMEVPSERIVAASPAASTLLNRSGVDVAGRNFEDFTVDEPSGILEIFATGRLSGFESVRMLRRDHGPDVRATIWVHKFGTQAPVRFVLLVLVVDEVVRDPAQPAASPELTTVAGTTDVALLVERISSGAAELFGHPPSELLGCSLISLVAERDRPDYLSALGRASGSDNSFALNVEVNAPVDATRRRPAAVSCHLLILPLQPAPRCVFVFVPNPAIAPLEDAVNDLRGVVTRLSHGVEVTQLARSAGTLTEAVLPGLAQLTTREREIVTRLLNGDRVPAIAKSLFLTQSTVRSHLGSVFIKLGVAGQQELLDAVRRRSASSAGS